MHLRLIFFSYQSIFTCIVGAQKNRLMKTFLVENPQQYALLSEGLLKLFVLVKETIVSATCKNKSL